MSTAVRDLEQSGAVVAVDVGGTTVKGMLRIGDVVLDRAVVPTFGTVGPADGTVSGTPTAGTPTVGGPSTGGTAVGDPAAGGPALAAVVAVVDRLAAAATGAGHPLAAIGLCTPGVVDSAAGTVVVAVNLDWHDLPIADLLRERYGVPVAVAHDARAAATAEIAARTAAGRDVGEMVFIPIGTGISASLVVDGRLVVGAAGGAGEVGHVCIRPGGEPCTCGQRGCVEAYASARNIRRRYRAAGGTIDGATDEIVAAVDTDPVAAAVWADAVDALAAGVAILSAVLDPAVVVVGGGLGESGERLLAPLRTAVDARLGWRPSPRIEQSLAGAGAGLAGAALLARTAAATSTTSTTSATGTTSAPTSSAPATSAPAPAADPAPHGTRRTP
ncbi:ROK family protein [Curtobacterium sp. Csp2]|uniref:ROK family protein n=1 Tax=Curtobacterium sp. Csp2 TaxID=2495430 RepID=UPI0015803DFA|nr:ROK family protein [Curtobacterium sp. Csp2]QKS17490.1 ROK family protein [Curtobacterium sp. Csp2]